MSEMPDSSAPDSAGNLRDVPLPEVLKSILERRRTGTLRLVRPEEEIQLFFEAGELRTALSSAAGRRLGDSLRREGVITDEAMGAAVRELRELLAKCQEEALSQNAGSAGSDSGEGESAKKPLFSRLWSRRSS